MGEEWILPRVRAYVFQLDQFDHAFCAFRYRQFDQLVPEFNKFLQDNPIIDPRTGLPVENGSELLGARLVGRWKSGMYSSVNDFEQKLKYEL